MKSPINLNLNFIRYNHNNCQNLIKTVPKLYFTNNEIPSNLNKTPTHELFNKSQFFIHPKPGLVHWLPIGISILNKLTGVIENRMNEIGGEQLKLSNLSHSSLWELTSRWENNELFKLTDSQDQKFCLVATCEEEITQLVSQQINSYKSLPLIFYQINDKFRDEKRPRSGLLRGREFLMKDAYSFDINETNAMITYNNVVGAYYKIFQDLNIPFIKADADTGDIGGSLSHEWHYLHKSAGEDTLFTCDHCNHSSNLEKTLSFPIEEQTINEVSVKYYKTFDDDTLICVYWPSNRILQPNFLKFEIPDIDLSEYNETELLSQFNNQETAILKKIIRIMDSRLNSNSNFPDFPINFINRSLITTLTDIPLVSAEEGELCYHCEEGTLTKHKSIEVGHTFYLGDKYSQALNCNIDIPQEDGKLLNSPMMMGCYGIGVSRIIAAIGEINRDEKGFRWPSIISPWDLTIINLNLNKNNQIEIEDKNENFNKFYSMLNENNIDYRLDNREKIGLGKKIKQSNLIGIPLTIIIGSNWPIIEIEIRGLKIKGLEKNWKNLYNEKTFDWDIIYNENGDDIKHLVHIDGFVKVVKCLLQSM